MKLNQLTQTVDDEAASSNPFALADKKQTETPAVENRNLRHHETQTDSNLQF